MGSLDTRASLLLRLKATDVKPRELAWGDFQSRYSPVIAGFARKMGAARSEIDDIVQDVLVGFYEAQPRFQYDPAKGRFRGYLKTVTWRAFKHRADKRRRIAGTPIEEVDEACVAVTQAWDQIWETELLRRALELTRTQYQNNTTFQAFERVALADESPDDVATALSISVDSVYKAKQRVTEAVRQHLAKFEDEEG